ncbi:MAG: hypothetical protein RIT14_1252 [Pseudomonadota bacterium]|jgi:hypothetical protein
MDLILQQLIDPFRIGMVFFLLLTSRRTQAAMGMVTPLALGVVFVAALIPLTIQSELYPAFADKLAAFGYGLISNAIILGLCLAGWQIMRRLRN